jgi:TRAP-type C4-dicarboxylate transport system substrate-binding protein
MSRSYFESLEPDIQQAIREVAEEVGRFHRELGAKEDVRYRAMLEEQLEITEIDRDAFAARTESLYQEFNEHYGSGLVATIRSYRAQD